MPDTSVSPYSTLRLLRHLWRRRWLLLLLPPALVILTYLLVRAFGGETFESSAIVKVRMAASEMRLGPELDTFTPPVYEHIFLNDSLLKGVIDKARQELPGYPQSNFERLKKQFSIKVEATRETVVVAEYSPMIRMTARGGSPDDAYFLVSSWLDMTLERFGQFRAQEARSLRESFFADYDTLRTEADVIQEAEAEAQQRLLDINSRLTSLYRILDGGGDPPRLGPDPGTTSDGRWTGLATERVRLELAVAEQTAAGDNVSMLQARLERVASLIEEIEGEITQLGAEKATVTRRIGQARERLLLLREQMEQLREVIATTTPDATIFRDPMNPEIQGAFSVYSWPVKPELRVAPPRSLIAIVVGIGMGFLLLLLVMLEFYLRVALAEEDS